MSEFVIGGKTVSVYPAAHPGAPAVYLNTFAEEGPKVRAALKAAGCPPLTLVTISGLDWNRDLSPWPCPSPFPRTPPFAGGADAYLRLLCEEILPGAESVLETAPRWRGIAGYSLAGLFALYALCGTAAFSRAASASGSLWFPGFREYLFSHEPLCRPDRLYFSLGNRESRTRNPLLRTVQEATEEIRAFYQGRGISTVFQQNPGNHYSHTPERTAAAIAWLADEGNVLLPRG